jgi:hypothetical protein
LLDQVAQATGASQGERERLKHLDPRDQAAIIERLLVGATSNFHREIASQFDTDRYSLLHGLVASMQVHEAVTTNFDRLYESAAESAGRESAVLPYENVESGQSWLLKLHGSIEEEDIVLTRRDYLDIPVAAGALLGVVQALLLTRHMLFLGYSLIDEDFNAIVDQVRRARGRRSSASQRRLGTAITLFEDPLFSELWSDALEIVAVAASPKDPQHPDAN